jgi:hypothetical protein
MPVERTHQGVAGHPAAIPEMSAAVRADGVENAHLSAFLRPNRHQRTLAEAERRHGSAEVTLEGDLVPAVCVSVHWIAVRITGLRR